MTTAIEPEIKVVGELNGWTIETESIFKKFYLKKKVRQDDGTMKEKSFPVKVCRKNVHLSKVNQAGRKDTLTFSIYIHQGKMFYRDSRDKVGSNNDVHVLKEMTRLLKINAYEARKLLVID